MSAGDWTRVYTSPTARRAHFLAPGESANNGDPAMCGRSPGFFGSNWFGTGTQLEYEHALTLPVCARCRQKLPDEIRRVLFDAQA